MDAQHQKTNKSAQFACYLREHTSSSSSITSYIYLFALLFPPSSICSSYTAHSSRTTGQASKQASNKERAKVFGDDLFFFLSFFWSRRQKATTRTTYLTLPPSLQTGEPRTAEPWTATSKPNHYVWLHKSGVCMLSSAIYGSRMVRQVPGDTQAVSGKCGSSRISSRWTMWRLQRLSRTNVYTQKESVEITEL